MTARTISGPSDFLAKFHDYDLGIIMITFGQDPLTLVCGLKTSAINSVLLSLLLASPGPLYFVPQNWPLRKIVTIQSVPGWVWQVVHNWTTERIYNEQMRH